MTREREVDQPSITVVIPAHDAAAFIGNAVGSVCHQSMRPLEIVVVDDGPIDDTAAVVEQWAGITEVPIRLIRQTHKGAAAARNRAIQAAQGEWIAFLDADDFWQEEKLAAIQEAIRTHPESRFIAHDVHEVLPDGRIVERVYHRIHDPRRPLLPQLYRANFLFTSSVTVHRDALRQVSAFDEGLGSAHDLDLWLKLSRQERLTIIPRSLATYVNRAGSISDDTMQRLRCALAVAYRHAPALAPLVGWRVAYWLRLRRIALIHYYRLVRKPGLRKGLSILRAAVGQIARAAILPLSAGQNR